MKILSIGDIHGRNCWKDKLFGSVDEFEFWAKMIFEGVDPKDMTYPYQQYDRIIFVGDYVDSFTVRNIDMKKNLEDIVLFKKTELDRVVLLIGNHDVQYIVPNQICSGYRPEMKMDFGQIFKENSDLFKFAHLEIVPEGAMKIPCNKFLFTHAGVTRGWYKELRQTLFDPRYRLFQTIRDRENDSIDQILNLAWELREDVLFHVDRDSGGWNAWAGPVWVRPTKLRQYSIPGYSQVVGHTPHQNVTQHPVYGEADTITHTLTFVDCLEHGDVNDYYTIEYEDHKKD